LKVAILQSNYVPWKGYFDLIQEVDVFVIYDCVKYTKNDWRNRNIIYPKNGKQWLSIPIPASSVKVSIDKVQISDARWQKVHAKALSIGYARAQHFGQLQELIEGFLINKQWQSLSNLNIELICWICGKLGFKTEIRNAREFPLHHDRVEKLLGILQAIGATEYLSGPTAAGYLDSREFLFSERGIKLRYKSYGPYLPYKQLREPFEHMVSIVDLIANLPWEKIPKHLRSCGSLFN
jgi:hypothetical protein